MRNIHSAAHLCLALSMVFACSMPAFSEDPFVVFEDGQATAVLVVPVDASDDINKAVETFRETLEEGYGIEMSVENAGYAEGRRIELVVEERPILDEDRTTVTFPAEQVMRIKGGEYGVIRTLFYILEEYAGVRYLYQSSGKHRTHYPPLSELAIPRKTIERDSAYEFGRATVRTDAYYGPAPETRRYLWNWEVKLGAKRRVDFHHALASKPGGERGARGVAFPIHEYAEAEQKPDEAMFPILNGARYLPYEQSESRWRHSWQPCFTSQAAVDEAATNLIDYLEAHSETRSLPLGVNDLGNHCQCEACLAMDAADQLNGFNMPNRSESYYRWVNQVAERVTARFPDVYFGVIAYREVFAAPTVELHPNVVVVITLEFNVTIDPAMRAERYGNIRDWGEKASHLGFWSYDTGPFTYTLPRVFFKHRQDIVRHVRDHRGRIGMSSGAHYFTAAEGPKAYLHFKLLEDPDLDLEATLVDWCDAMVGPEASPYLQQYWAFWEDYWQNKATRVDQWWDRRDAHYLQRGLFSTYMYGLEPGDIAHCRELMEKVVSLAEAHGTPGQKERAHLQMACFEWYEAAAIASGAELISPEGKLADAQAAVALLRRIPQAVESFGRWHTILEETSDWLGRNWILRRNIKDVVAFSMTTLGPFLNDPVVRDELSALAEDKRCPSHIRDLAVAMLDSTAGGMPTSVLSDGSFERDGGHGWAVAHPAHGEVHQTSERAADGSRALRFDVEHGNFSARTKIDNVQPNTGYFIAARIYISEAHAEASPEGRLQFWGEPVVVGWNRPEWKLKAGAWNYICAYVPANAGMNELKITAHLPRVEDGTDVYLDQLQVYEIQHEQ